ncbi:ferritin-like domain-containing protein [Verticiella sediminum]|uniref:Ferritin-like domain-containing protein n=1 Tax=Verticiella sediminum TaxID=1247510 RepID=A0A556AEU0_9BURK|nr:ferritin-like domain-containing protein [Verticiella sediminum]TSH91385.1 ferritin-like domain-containing protein [Verticiella sediminum]
MIELRRQALAALLANSWQAKLDATAGLDGIAAVDAAARLQAPAGVPGRPSAPELVPATRVKQRSVHSERGRAVLLHALAHIEFNAINLALDAIWRFPGLPEPYYRDWARVAVEESLHFRLLNERLASLGHAYGDFPAHNGLWDMADKTRDDLLARLALVPRTLEARGLDASPLIRDKLAGVGDAAAAGVLDIILRDEIGHVSIGNHWYRWVCEQRGLDPLPTYDVLAERYGAPRLRGPFNREARLAAGFTPEEIDKLISSEHLARA